MEDFEDLWSAPEPTGFPLPQISPSVDSRNHCSRADRIDNLRMLVIPKERILENPLYLWESGRLSDKPSWLWFVTVPGGAIAACLSLLGLLILDGAGLLDYAAIMVFAMMIIWYINRVLVKYQRLLKLRESGLFEDLLVAGWKPEEVYIAYMASTSHFQGCIFCVFVIIILTCLPAYSLFLMIILLAISIPTLIDHFRYTPCLRKRFNLHLSYGELILFQNRTMLHILANRVLILCFSFMFVYSLSSKTPNSFLGLTSFMGLVGVIAFKEARVIKQGPQQLKILYQFALKSGG